MDGVPGRALDVGGLQRSWESDTLALGALIWSGEERLGLSSFI